MIKQLTLTNFRKHECTSLSFGPGLTAIRGLNESGKTTLTEAITYALFGSKALRTPLADTVTWGKPESSLQVSLTLEVGGKDYLFTRGKSGAEALDGSGTVIVTGQNDVSNYTSHLLGVDVQAASRLMMASQNGLRGALEQGPKATAQAIEELADFDLFDRLIERMQEKLLLGSPALLEGRMKQAEETLANTPDPVKPDAKGTEAAVALHEVAIAQNNATIAEIEPKLLELSSRVDRAEVAQRMHEGIVNDLRRANEQRDLHVEQRKANEVKAARVVDEAEIAALRDQVRDAEAHNKRLALYGAFEICQTLYQNWARSNPVWEGDKASFDAEIKAVSDSLQTARKQKADLEGDIKALHSQRITASACGLCGKDVSELPQVIEKNAELTRLVGEAAALVSQLSQDIAEKAETLADLEVVRAQDSKMSRELTGFSDLQYDHSTVPPTVSWVGAVPVAASAEDCKGRLDELENLKVGVASATAKVSALTDSLTEDDDRIARLEAQLIEYPAVGDVSDLKKEVQDLANAKGHSSFSNSELTREIEGLRRILQQAEMEFNAASDRKAAAAAQVTQARAELDELAFNNTLLKKIRGARPIIADKLWALILTSASSLFSSSRGEKSVVSKSSDGFSVNGQAVESLSGSTLDLLGLSIRISLIKTFLPCCPFLILDEAAANMDEARTRAMLALVVSANFSQSILVTHEDISESVADNLVYL